MYILVLYTHVINFKTYKDYFETIYRQIQFLFYFVK